MTRQTVPNEQVARQLEASGVVYPEWNIYQRMLKVTEAVERVPKGDKKVANQYKFTSHDAVMAALRPAFVKYGICMIPTVVNRTQDGNRTEVDMSIDFVNCDKPDDKVTVCTFGYGIDSQDKGPGKAISYAVKYACLKAFALDTGDDPESDQSTEHKPAKTASNSSMRSADDPNWTGPLNKTALKKASNDVSANIQLCGELDQLDAYVASEECQAIVKQLRADLPDWWDAYGKAVGEASNKLMQRDDEVPADDFADDRPPDFVQ